jgi:DNA-directed RNA polymerase subunit RPC12/RpoP
MKDYRLRNREKAHLTTKTWKKNNPEKMSVITRRHRLKKCYGLSLEDFDLLLASQDYKCAICKKHNEEELEQLGSNLSVDHNHETQEIRGLLCRSCNFLIRNHVTPEIFYKAAEYLSGKKVKVA